MKLTHILLSGGIVSCIATAAPVPLLNFLGEISRGVDGTPISLAGTEAEDPLMPLQLKFPKANSYSA
jgi:hypothetical protein